MNSYDSQWKILLHWFLNHPGEGITGKEIEEKLGIMNYKGRVSDVRKRGYPVKRDWREVPNRYGKVSRIAVYYIPKSEVPF